MNPLKMGNLHRIYVCASNGSILKVCESNYSDFHCRVPGPGPAPPEGVYPGSRTEEKDFPQSVFFDVGVNRG